MNVTTRRQADLGLCEAYRSLRQEILLRIGIQNLLLVAALVMYGVTAILMTGAPVRAGWLAAVYVAVGFGAALVWTHNGARMIQIRTYLRTIVEPGLSGDAPGWESWLREHPFGGLLGSRWAISTKGMLLGSQALAIGQAVVVGDVEGVGAPLWIGVVGTLLTAGAVIHPRLPEGSEEADRGLHGGGGAEGVVSKHG